MHNRLLIVMISLSGLTACNQSDPAEEVHKYCDCLESAVGEAAMASCRRQRDELVKKYEFDPEASEIIAEELKNCGEHE